MKNNWILEQLVSKGLSSETAEQMISVGTFVIIMLGTILVTLKLRAMVHRLIERWVKSNRFKIDDLLIQNRVINTLSWVIPLVASNLLLDMMVPAELPLYLFGKRLLKVLLIFLVTVGISGLLSTVADGFRLLRPERADFFKGLTDAARILCFVIGGIFIISVLSGVTPWGIVSVLGGLTAVTMLIFKDTILGFVASLQLTMGDMVKVGDWIEMSSYGADGDVVSMSIHTVKVQNWDKTITTIPTHALVSSSFKNWRGMSESGGRRIKRAIQIDISTVHFCDKELLERLHEIVLLRDYLDQKQREIAEYNRKIPEPVDHFSSINGRRQTNIGIFRAYVAAYLRNNPLLSKDMTFLVRQLPPTEKGLPLEIYVFCTDQRWANYEAIQADIFDHLLAVLPLFELRVFQNPSGYDFRGLSEAV
jgi:miniconductance mechanosensitive channel